MGSKSVTLLETNIALGSKEKHRPKPTIFGVPAVSFREGTTHFTPLFCLDHLFLMASQPTPSKVIPPRNKALLRA